MVRVKSHSSSPSPSRGGVEEFESFDLFTPDTLTLVGSDTPPTNPRKRSSTAYSDSPSAKRASTVSSVISRASTNSRTSAAPKKKKPPQVKAQPKPRVKAPKIIFGFDFGTTYSGIAYAYSGDGKKIDILMSWDDTNNDYVKIPSAIKFTDQEDIWGVDAKHLPDALRWFKLTLVNASDLDVGVRDSEQLNTAHRALKAEKMLPEDAISAYLEQVWKHCIEKLKVAEGEETVDTSCFHIVFTIPAMWPNYARQRMERAVEQAGILKRRQAGRTGHEFVSEPEAAALATLSGIEGRHNIEINDIFAVIDCGGGTVDVISYRTVDTDPMTVEEAVTGKGDLCGAIFVDERFKELLISKLQEFSDEAMDYISEEEIQDMMSRNWEDEIRNQFSGAEKTWTIRLPYSLIDGANLDLSNGHPKLTITSAEVEEVFSPVVKKIYSLVNRQIQAAIKKFRRAPKYVILVGGFGSSKYLREYLKQRCLGVEILQRRGSEPWSAISRGAVIHGMTKLKLDTPFSVDVRSRISRTSYGKPCEVPYDDNVHHLEHKTFNPVLQMYVVPDVMKWHLVQGQDIYADRNPKFTFTKFLAKLPKKIETVIYMSRADVPPERKDDSVKEIFRLTWDMQIDWESLPLFTNSQGQTFRKLEYEVDMKCSAAATVFSIWHGGYKQVGKIVDLTIYETADI